MSFFNIQNETNQSAWPPPFQMRRSKRARLIRVNIDAVTGIELIVPLRQSEQEAILFLNSKRAWIEKHAAIWLNPRAEFVASVIPSEIHLRSLDLLITVKHDAASQVAPKFYLQDSQLIFKGSIEQFFCLRKGISRWLKKMAVFYIAPFVEQLAQQYQFKYTKVVFRKQKTLWGSCSRRGIINLNYKLLFLPQNLVRYVLLHELCHTIHFNHSKRFWLLLNKCEPNSLILRKMLRQADQFIPFWFS